MSPRQASQDRRAADRAKRRAGKTAPEEERTEELQSEAAEAIWEAASAAIVGAAVGAAQALARKREEGRQDPPAEEPEAAEPEAAEPQDAREEPEPEAEAEEPPPEPQEPGRPGDAPRMVQRARQQLQELRGADAESVSGVARTGSGWRIGLEVVEVRRIPESTDVLGTYEVELDADGELLTFERTRRYYRSEAERR